MNTFRTWTKQHEDAFIVLCIVLCGLLGGGICLLIGALAGVRPSIDILMCCIGYPGVIFGFWGSILWLYRKDDESEGHYHE